MPFFPDFALIEAITGLCYLVVLLILAAITEPSLEEAADPTASGYVPRPEWYFMWAFQSLKYFNGESEIFGTFIIPTIAIGLLVALPFLDRRSGQAAVPRHRPIRRWPRSSRLVTTGSRPHLPGDGLRAPMTRA
jgi:quinol-cytochrome oxidoreductase complex cytochrome b subunit